MEDGGSSASGNNLLQFKRNLKQNISPRSPLSPQSADYDSIDLAMEDSMVDNNIDHLYNNIYEMASSNMSPSMHSFTTYGNESRIDAELRHLVGAQTEEEEDDDPNHKPEILKDVVIVTKGIKKAQPQLNLEKRKTKPPVARKPKNLNSEETDHSNLGPYLLKKARDLISHGDNPKKAFELTLRAKNSFEKISNQDKKLKLDYVMCLHILASMHCSSEEYAEAVPLLEKSIEIIPEVGSNQRHALAKFAGCMQLGDVYAAMGKSGISISLYKQGLEIQRESLGDKDPRFGETCRYVAQACVQALQFDEAEILCQMALNTHNEPGSIEESADRRLMGLICDSKGNHESALQYYSLASMVSNNQETERAVIEVNIGDAYLALARYDEAVISYQKAVNVFKLSKGENHSSVGSVYVRLAELYYKVGKFSESKSYCENALRIFSKPASGSSLEEIASGFIELAAIYESMNEFELSINLLQKALKIHNKKTRGMSRQTMVAGLEAQMGVMYYMIGNYNESYNSLKNAVMKLQSCGEKSSLLGIALNQLGLTCLQLCAMTEAAEIFEQARTILNKKYGPCHPETLAVCSNLAATYDVLGKWDDAIELMEFVVEMREEKLGTADPVVDDEKKRLEDMLKESGKGRSKKTRSLEFLLDKNTEMATTQTKVGLH